MSKASRFVNYLISLERRRDTGAMAALRRGLTELPGNAVEMHSYVARWAWNEPTRWREETYYLVASLFALHPSNWSPRDGEIFSNFGASLARTAVGDAFGSAEKRFRVLLRSGRDDLHLRLRHAIRHLKSEDIPVDWERLMGDLARWEEQGDRVRKEWARAFYASTHGNDGSKETEE